MNLSLHFYNTIYIQDMHVQSYSLHLVCLQNNELLKCSANWDTLIISKYEYNIYFFFIIWRGSGLSTIMIIHNDKIIWHCRPQLHPQYQYHVAITHAYNAEIAKYINKNIFDPVFVQHKDYTYSMVGNWWLCLWIL